MPAPVDVEWDQFVVTGEETMERPAGTLLIRTILIVALLGLAVPAAAKEKKGCAHKPSPVPPGPMAPLLSAVAALPAVHDLPRGTDQVSLSALVALDDKNIVLLDGVEARKKGRTWTWDAVRATADGGRKRRDELRKAGARPHACPDSPDKWLRKIYRSIRSKKWDEVLLPSTHKRNPKAHSLVDDIEADLKVCGKTRYLDTLKHRLPTIGAIPPEVLFFLVTYQVTGKDGLQVELGIIPVEDGWRVAHLRMICTK